MTEISSHLTHFHYGRVKDGIVTSENAGGTPDLVSGQWYNFKIEVGANKQVEFSMNNQLLGTFTASFSTRGYGGVIVANGYDSVVQFRGYDVIPKI